MLEDFGSGAIEMGSAWDISGVDCGPSVNDQV